MMLSPNPRPWCDFLIMGLAMGALFGGCAPLNQDIEEDLSTDPKTCLHGHRYLPFTNGTDEAFTSEGKEIPCKDPSSQSPP